VLPSFLPGVCFEISVFLANPQPFQTYAGQARLDRYSTGGIALIGSFVLGFAFTCFANLLQSGLFRLRRQERQLWPRLLTYLLFRKASMKPLWAWISRSQVVNRAYQKEIGENQSRLRGAHRAWRRTARQLLQQRYGIELPAWPDPPDHGEWYFWTGALGTTGPEPIKGMLFITTIHATGWSGLAAAYCAPFLRNRFYLAVPLFLIGYSLLQIWRVAGWWSDPITPFVQLVRRALADIPSVSSPAGEKKTGDVPKVEEG
jgi:hypothetical protein